MTYNSGIKMIVPILTLATLPLVCAQRTIETYPPEKVTWQPKFNGMENKYMHFADDWKKEIVTWAKECIFEIRNRIFQLDQIDWASADDMRYQIGKTIGRILEIQRQQQDMFRRMKRRFENKFNWIRPELAGNYPQLKVDGAVESVPGKTQNFPFPWEKKRPNNNDYKPHVYIVALEFITKKEIEIEHLIGLLTDYVGEEEVAFFKPHYLPGDHGGAANVWAGYATRTRVPGKGRRAWATEDPALRREEVFKAKMRADYYNKKKINKNK